jgi:hypothetical protein
LFIGSTFNWVQNKTNFKENRLSLLKEFLALSFDFFNFEFRGNIFFFTNKFESLDEGLNLEVFELYLLYFSSISFLEEFDVIEFIFQQLEVVIELKNPILLTRDFTGGHRKIALC